MRGLLGRRAYDDELQERIGLLEREDAAAVSIQSGWRAQQARWNMRQRRTARDRELEEECAGIAAVFIQAGWRGKQARRVFDNDVRVRIRF